MSTSEVRALLQGQKEMRDAITQMGKRLGFLERTVYTFVGGVMVLAFLISTGHLQIGSN